MCLVEVLVQPCAYICEYGIYIVAKFSKKQGIFISEDPKGKIIHQVPKAQFCSHWDVFGNKYGLYFMYHQISSVDLWGVSRDFQTNHTASPSPRRRSDISIGWSDVIVTNCSTCLLVQGVTEEQRFNSAFLASSANPLSKNILHTAL